MKKILIISSVLLSMSNTAHSTSISNDIEIMFPDMGADQSSEPLYKSIGFDVSMLDGEAQYTVNASVDLSNTWRVFGEFNTEKYWELGVGKSFYTDVMALEVSAKLTDYGFSAGTFMAMPVVDKVMLFGEINYNWNTRDLHVEMDKINSVYTPADTIDIQIGMLWNAHEYLAVSYSFNQIYETQGAKLDSGITLPAYDISHKHHYVYGKGSMNYHKLTFTGKLWKLAPYFSYSYMSNSENIYEFGVSFNF
jgi:hypothetical protein